MLLVVPGGAVPSLVTSLPLRYKNESTPTVTRKDLPVGTALAGMLHAYKTTISGVTLRVGGRLWQRTSYPRLFALVASIRRNVMARRRAAVFMELPFLVRI
jgi:hypothetical protein